MDIFLMPTCRPADLPTILFRFFVYRRAYISKWPLSYYLPVSICKRSVLVTYALSIFSFMYVISIFLVIYLVDLLSTQSFLTWSICVYVYEVYCSILE